MPRVMTIGRIGTLGACACSKGTRGTEAPVTFAGVKRGKRRGHKGKFCVVSKRGKVFNCYANAKTAKRMAKKLGFKVKR